MNKLTVTLHSRRIPTQTLEKALGRIEEQMRVLDPETHIEHHVSAGPVIRIERGDNTVHVDGRPVDMAASSHDLICMLYDARGVMTHADVIERVKLRSTTDNSARSLVKRTRDALYPLDIIHTVRHQGWKLNRAYTYIVTEEADD